MATYTVDKLEYNSNTYELQNKEKTNLIWPVKGTQTAATASWTGAIDLPALYDGLTIAYYLPYAGVSNTNVTLNLTLSDGTTTGAKNVYFNNATRLTTHYGAGSTILFTYWSAGSISVAGTATTDDRWTHSDYNSNTTYTNMTQTEADTGTATTARSISAKVLNDTILSKAAAAGHTHATSIATSTATNQITLAANSKYVLTAGGTTYVFTTPSDTNTTYTASTTSIGSASAGTAIAADDITAWTTNTPTAVTKKTVVTSASGATAAVSNGVLTLTNGSFSTGDSVTVTAGTSASLSYTARSIPNISVTSKTVATGITAN